MRKKRNSAQAACVPGSKAKDKRVRAKPSSLSELIRTAVSTQNLTEHVPPSHLIATSAIAPEVEAAQVGSDGLGEDDIYEDHILLACSTPNYDLQQAPDYWLSPAPGCRRVAALSLPTSMQP
jgi:hypothetical protein